MRKIKKGEERKRSKGLEGKRKCGETREGKDEKN